jgi:DNA anti-recombination protein RmuC
MTRPRFANRILIPERYVPAEVHNDAKHLRKRFASELKRIAEEKRRREADATEAAEKTVTLPRKRA